jgi:hypothetical protein
MPDSEQTLFRRFFAALRENPDVVRSGRTYVDVPGAVLRRVACSDGVCMRERRGRELIGKTCCTTFSVPVEPRDVRRIERVLPELARVRDVGRAVERAGGFHYREGRQEWLRTRPSGACVFLSAPAGEPPRCTIHEWALGRGLDHRLYKPEACCLFPLYLVEWGDEVLVTGYGSALMREMEPEEAGQIERFRCTHPRGGAGRPLVVEQREELEYRLGARCWAAARRRLAELGHEV